MVPFNVAGVDVGTVALYLFYSFSGHHGNSSRTIVFWIVSIGKSAIDWLAMSCMYWINLSLKWLNILGTDNTSAEHISIHLCDSDHLAKSHLYTYAMSIAYISISISGNVYNFSLSCNSIGVHATCSKLHCLHIALAFRHTAWINWMSLVCNSTYVPARFIWETSYGIDTINLYILLYIFRADAVDQIDLCALLFFLSYLFRFKLFFSEGGLD